MLSLPFPGATAAAVQIRMAMIRSGMRTHFTDFAESFRESEEKPTEAPLKPPFVLEERLFLLVPSQIVAPRTP